ncbi:SGNH/GDSL hydrolase family protein [Spirosoma sp. SC4-14]|uniref:SGNH/GDSL hydrolase family protein n=1 Tax=Spirosoma sp. SC4-14 TaxID=3128900 RepID=UPI0030D4681E
MPVEPSFKSADNPTIQYIGRIDFSNPLLPRFWASGVYIKAKFTGSFCDIVVNDELHDEINHNYLSIIVDNAAPVRIQTRSKTDTIKVIRNLPEGEHMLTICKDTEASAGYLEFVGLYCQELLPLPPKPMRKMEFIGNSITCGAGSDLSISQCGHGNWYDKHNAYLSYGPTVARAFNAQWQLSSVSGIGLIRSCCSLPITMPQVYDKINMWGNYVNWNFNQYVPDVVSICLGQNDGIQDSTAFCSAYIKFITTIRSHYPNAYIVCVASPMANALLAPVLKKYLTSIVQYANARRMPNVGLFFFSQRYHGGCGDHPTLAEHALMAQELTAFLAQELHWES